MEDLRTCSGEYWAVPECRSSEELNLLRKLYTPHAGKTSWDVSFKRELDMTLDSDLFVLESEKKNDESYMPLYEGRMVTQYNCYSKKYVSGNGRTAKWEKVTDLNDRTTVAHYYVNEKDISDRGIDTGYRAAYCDVTGQKNVRTVLSTLIPSNTVCGNKVPTCVFENNDLRLHLLWIGIANSFVVDWMLRKKMSITLNFYHWHQIPFPYIDVDSNEAIDICAAVAKILFRKNGIDVVEGLCKPIIERYDHFENESNEDLRAMIDIIIADYFCLNLYELALVLYDFQALDQRVNGVPGDLRYETGRQTSYVTRDTLLHYYVNSHSLKDDSIVEIYRKTGIDIKRYTSKGWHSLNARVDFYKNNNICAYTD